MNDYGVARYVMADVDTFVARIAGPYRFADSRQNALKLVQRFASLPHKALMIDYQACTLCHTREQFAAIGEILARGLPATLPIAYLYGARQAGHVILITRILSAHGHFVRSFTEIDAARHWLRDVTGNLIPLRRSA